MRRGIRQVRQVACDRNGSEFRDVAAQFAGRRARTTSLNEKASKRVLSGGGETRRAMLWTIFVVLLVLWLLGLVTSYTLGGFIYLLLVAAIIVLIIQLVTGRRHVV